MKRLAAHLIEAIAAVFVTWAIGASVRQADPFADPSVPRDLAVGGSVVGAGIALRWADKELHGDR